MAYSLIESPRAREAFDLNKEPAKLREKYGKNQAGQRFLLARLGGKTIRVRIEREEGFTHPLVLKILFNPPGFNSSREIKIPEKGKEGSFYLNAGSARNDRFQQRWGRNKAPG